MGRDVGGNVGEGLVRSEGEEIVCGGDGDLDVERIREGLGERVRGVWDVVEGKVEGVVVG